MSFASYMTLVGKTQKLISKGASSLASIGNHYQEGMEDKIQVRSFNQGFFLPEGAQSGGRVHRPLVITKMMDSSTPLLLNAIKSGELLTLCKLDVYRISPVGLYEQFFTIKLTDAVIVDLDVMSPDFQDPAFAHVLQVEKVCFSYSSVRWSHDVSKTDGSDYWHEGTLV